MNGWPCFMNTLCSCVSGSGERVTLSGAFLSLFTSLPGSGQTLFACSPLICARFFRSSASCFALILLLFFLAGGSVGVLICCESCHCEAPTEFLPCFPSPAQTQEMVLKQMMVALSHGARLPRRPRLNNTHPPLSRWPVSRSAGAPISPTGFSHNIRAGVTSVEPLKPSAQVACALCQSHNQNHSAQQNRANKQPAPTFMAAFSCASEAFH